MTRVITLWAGVGARYIVSQVNTYPSPATRHSPLATAVRPHA